MAFHNLSINSFSYLTKKICAWSHGNKFYKYIPFKLRHTKYLVLENTNMKALREKKKFGVSFWKQSVIFKASVRTDFKLFSPWRKVLCPSVLGYQWQQTSPLLFKAFLFGLFRVWGFFWLLGIRGFIHITTPLQIFKVERRLLGSQTSKFKGKVILACNNTCFKGTPNLGK